MVFGWCSLVVGGGFPLWLVVFCCRFLSVVFARWGRSCSSDLAVGELFANVGIRQFFGCCCFCFVLFFFLLQEDEDGWRNVSTCLVRRSRACFFWVWDGLCPDMLERVRCVDTPCWR